MNLRSSIGGVDGVRPNRSAPEEEQQMNTADTTTTSQTRPAATRGYTIPVVRELPARLSDNGDHATW